MTDWKYYLVTRVETEEQIERRIETEAESNNAYAMLSCAIHEIEAAQKEIERLKAENEALQNKIDKVKNFLETVSKWFWKRQGYPLPQWADEFEQVCQTIELKGGE